MTITPASITPASITPESTIVFLSDRERQVLGLVCQGASNKAIAGSLGLTPGTVKQYLRSLYCGLGLSSRFELILWSQQYPQIFSDPAPPLHAPDCPCPAMWCSAMRVGDPLAVNQPYPMPRAA